MWVIEKYLGGKLVYYSPGARGRSAEDNWSEDFSWELKMHDEESAEKVLFHLTESQGRCAQHGVLVK